MLKLVLKDNTIYSGYKIMHIYTDIMFNIADHCIYLRIFYSKIIREQSDHRAYEKAMDSKFK